MTNPINHLTWIEIEDIAAPIRAGTATSAMTITYGCGHTVHRQNGDPIHHTCPYHYAERLARLDDLSNRND